MNLFKFKIDEINKKQIKNKPYGIEYLLFHSFCKAQFKDSCGRCPFNRVVGYSDEQLYFMSDAKYHEVCRLDCSFFDSVLEDAINGKELSEEDIQTIKDIVTLIKKEVERNGLKNL